MEERRLDSLPAEAPLLVVSDTRRALRDLAVGHRSRLDARFIGITGSAGKTTVKEMTADLLQSIGPTARTRGNWNNDIGLPLSLLAMAPGQPFGVFELGTNHPGELAPLSRILRHECGVVTTVGMSHAEFFAEQMPAQAGQKCEQTGRFRESAAEHVRDGNPAFAHCLDQAWNTEQRIGP